MAFYTVVRRVVKDLYVTVEADSRQEAIKLSADEAPAGHVEISSTLMNVTQRGDDYDA